MTKTDLYNRLAGEYRNKVCTIEMKKALDEFFKDKVIIQRGENRHPYADVFHEWAEAPIKGIQISTDEYNYSDCLRYGQYRIKPSEPVYEWQFVYLKANNTAGITRFYTDEESKGCHQFTKIEETKRERKQ